MSVLECSCGMVMSVSVAMPRNRCIRCGCAEFRELEHFKLAVIAMDKGPLVPVATCGKVLPFAITLDGCRSGQSKSRWLFSLVAHAVEVVGEFTNRNVRAIPQRRGRDYDWTLGPETNLHVGDSSSELGGEAGILLCLGVRDHSRHHR